MLSKKTVEIGNYRKKKDFLTYTKQPNQKYPVTSMNRKGTARCRFSQREIITTEPETVYEPVSGKCVANLDGDLTI